MIYCHGAFADEQRARDKGTPVLLEAADGLLQAAVLEQGDGHGQALQHAQQQPQHRALLVLLRPPAHNSPVSCFCFMRRLADAHSSNSKSPHKSRLSHFLFRAFQCLMLSVSKGPCLSGASYHHPRSLKL